MLSKPDEKVLVALALAHNDLRYAPIFHWLIENRDKARFNAREARELIDIGNAQGEWRILENLIDHIASAEDQINKRAKQAQTRTDGFNA